MITSNGSNTSSRSPVPVCPVSRVGHLLIVVARHRPALLRDLTAVYGHEGEVTIVVDRRRPWMWPGPGVDRRIPQDGTDLESQGFLVIEQI